jgi:gluconolactonase
MRNQWLLVCALSLAFSSPWAPAADAEAVRRLDPSLNALVAADTRLETLLERETTFEGPTWIRNAGSGYLIFTDVPGNAIDKLNPDGSVSVFLDNIFAGKDKSDAVQSFGLNGEHKFWMLGANGTTLDRQGRVVYCALSDGQVVRLESDGTRTVLASRFEGSRLNRTNDLVYKSDGTLYFSDSGRSQKRSDGEGVPFKALYALKGSDLRLLSKDIDHPNGMAFSPDEKYLYVTNSLVKNVLRFDVVADGIANEKVLIDMSGEPGEGVPDGVKLDQKGNVYSTGPGGVWIISPSGKHLGTIMTPKHVNNLAFGGDDLKTLYMAAFGALYRIKMKVAGNPINHVPR